MSTENHPPNQESNMKVPNPDLNSSTSAKTLHAPARPNDTKDYPMHAQTEPTPGRDKVREELHNERSPRESKRPIERTARAKKS